MNVNRIIVTIAATLAISAGTAAPVLAAPDNDNTFTLDLTCSDGNAYTVTLLQTTPEQPAAHIVGTTSVLVPAAFAWHVVVTDDSEGTVLDETTSPPEAVHGRSVDRLDTVECTFTQFAHHDWPQVGAVTIATTGTVSAYIPG